VTIVNAGIKSNDEQAFSLCMNLYEEMKSCPAEQFAQRLSVLEQLYAAWLDCKLVLLTSLDIGDQTAGSCTNGFSQSSGTYQMQNSFVFISTVT
jgi:hypothetical protein